MCGSRRSAKSPHCRPYNIDGPRRMFSCPTVQKRVIRGHYDRTTPFYRLFWGPHIHHGLWEADESPREAQLQLTEQLATLAWITAGQQLVDIGWEWAHHPFTWQRREIAAAWASTLVRCSEGGQRS